MATSDRAELIVVAGGATTAALAGTDQVAARIQASGPGTVTVHHDLGAIERGVVVRTVRVADHVERAEVQLAHGCVSCTLREDVLPLVRALARRPPVRRIVLRLDPVLEPEQVCWALHHVVVGTAPVTDAVDVLGAVSVLDAATWLDDIASDSDVADAGLAPLPDDERTLAQLLVAHADFADLLVLAGDAGTDHDRLDAVLSRLNPLAPRVALRDVDHRVLLDDPPPGARRGVPDDPHGPLLRGAPPLEPVGDVRLLAFTARRPFHPARLHDAIDALLTGVVRAQGRIWLATRPDATLWMESAGGGLQLGYIGDWLATFADDDERWRGVDPERHALAALRWNPRWGDRAQELVVLIAGADPDRIRTALHTALLTDTELAAGEAAWRRFEDPFGTWHADPCEDLGAPPPRPVGMTEERDRRG